MWQMSLLFYFESSITESPTCFVIGHADEMFSKWTRPSSFGRMSPGIIPHIMDPQKDPLGGSHRFPIPPNTSNSKTGIEIEKVHHGIRRVKDKFKRLFSKRIASTATRFSRSFFFWVEFQRPKDRNPEPKKTGPETIWIQRSSFRF